MMLLSQTVARHSRSEDQLVTLGRTAATEDHIANLGRAAIDDQFLKFGRGATPEEQIIQLGLSAAAEDQIMKLGLSARAEDQLGRKSVGGYERNLADEENVREIFSQLLSDTPTEKKKKAVISAATKLDWLRSQIIGNCIEFATPFGKRVMTYADHTASARGLHFIENFLLQMVLPVYGNTHAEDSFVGRATGHVMEVAQNYVKACMGGTDDEAIMFCGSGSTAAIKRLQEVMGIAVPSTIRQQVLGTLKRSQRWVIFTGPYEHHSNVLTWRQTLAKVVEIPLSEEGGVDLGVLQAELEKYKNRSKLGSFSAGSNVTGILTDTRRIARLLHAHGAFACFDFAACAPYVKIDMKSGQPDGYDAVFVSPHKFMGGPGTPGILLMNKQLYRLAGSPPSTCGGGTVDFVNFDEQKTIYNEDVEHREDAGTPAIIQKVRTALVYGVKEFLTTELILSRESYFMEEAMSRLGMKDSIRIYGPEMVKRLAIMSFGIYPTSNERVYSDENADLDFESSWFEKGDRTSFEFSVPGRKSASSPPPSHWARSPNKMSSFGSPDHFSQWPKSPTRGNANPTRGNTSPTRGNTSPTRGNTSPTRGNASPLRTMTNLGWRSFVNSTPIKRYMSSGKSQNPVRPQQQKGPIAPVRSSKVQPTVRGDSAREKPLHGRFVVTLLNDLFGIQARGGCSCAGPYGHHLLGIGTPQSLALRGAIKQGYSAIKPGWSRVSFGYYLSNEEFEFLLAAIEFVADYGQRFLPLYDLDWRTGDWTFKGKIPQIRNMQVEEFYQQGLGELSSDGRMNTPLSRLCTRMHMKSAFNAPSMSAKEYNMKMLEYLKMARTIADDLPVDADSRRQIPDDLDPSLILFRH